MCHLIIQLQSVQYKKKSPTEYKYLTKKKNKWVQVSNGVYTPQDRF